MKDLRTQLQELQDDVERLRQEAKTAANEARVATAAATSAADAAAGAARAVERLTMIILGDEELRVPALVDDVATLKRERQTDMMDRARRAGVWVGASTVCVLVGKLLWALIDKYILKGG